MDDNTILMLGPAGSGKTTLLGVLAIASAVSRTNEAHQVVRDDEYDYPFTLIPKSKEQPVDPESEDEPVGPDTMKRLEEAALSSVAEGRLDAKIQSTEKVALYGFDFMVDLADTEEKIYSHNHGLMNHLHEGHFEVYDGPGGAVFGKDALAKYLREIMVKKAQNTKAVILCMDPSDRNSSVNFFQHLRPFLLEVGIPVPFERIAIILAKADRYALKNNWKRSDLNQDGDPTDTATRTLTSVGLGHLYNSLRQDCIIVCGWASAYGFIPHVGTPNFNEKSQCFASYSAGMDLNAILDSWRPFRVADPFIFALTGDPCSMQELRRH